MDQQQSLAGKVAFITGAARGQGRSHAVELARRGARVLAMDICEDIASVCPGLTVRSRQAVPRWRPSSQCRATSVALPISRPWMPVARHSHSGIVVANAGINLQRGQEPDAQAAFIDTIMVNLVGVWNTVHAIAPLMVERDQGGSIVLISSTNGLTGRGGDGTGAVTGYTASKHGVVGIMRSLMIWLAPHGIRINTIHPAGIPTPMVAHAEMQAWFAGNPQGHTMGNALPVAMLDPIDISRAVLYLVEESGRHITGITLPVDAGFTGK